MNNDIIFIIEDDAHYQKLYGEVLSNEFKYLCFDRLDAAINSFEAHPPATVILDLNLTNENGLELCSRLKSNGIDGKDLEIIVVSGDTSAEARIKAFEAGVSDFITKPFELKELKQKVTNAVARKRKEHTFKRELLDSQQLIYSSMEQASQYSNVMNFFKNLSHCKSVDEVANVFFVTMSTFKLVCSVRIELPAIKYFRSDKREVSPIEQDVYELLQNKGRIYPFSNRLIINDKHVSFIIKNPPSDEHELGQVRDYVAAIVEGLESKVLELYSQQGMTVAISDLSGNILNLKTGIQEHSHIINSVMSNMMLEIASSFHELEMTEPQETFLNNLIEKSTEQLSQAEEHLVSIMGGLEALKTNMLKIQNETSEVVKEPTPQNDDVELF